MNILDLLNMQAHLAASILEDIDDGSIDTASFLARVELLAAMVCEMGGAIGESIGSAASPEHLEP